jgi:hypothetical protein
LKTVRDVQRPLFAAIAQVSKKIGAKIYLADYVMSPRPTIWFCGTAAHKSQLVAFFKQKGIRIFALKGRQRIHFDPRNHAATHTIVYQKHVHSGVVIHGAASGIEVVFCKFEKTTDRWMTYRAGVESSANTTYLSALPEIDFLGARLPVLRNAKAVAEQRNKWGKVDLVYTWVNGEDIAWQERRRQAEGGSQKESNTLDSSQSARYISDCDLLFAVRSAIRYFTDIGKIYVVTDQQTPQILGPLLDRVTVVDHRDIFPEDVSTPTFNSHVIGAYVHRIQGLSERYLHLNDDICFGSALCAADFFDEYGRNHQFLSTAVSLPFEAKGKHTVAVNAAGVNNRRLLQEKLKVFAFRKFQHAALPTLRSVMFQMEQDLPEAWAATRCNRFRSLKDYSIAGALYQQYAAAKGCAVSASIRYAYFDTKNADSLKGVKVLLQDDWRRPQMFCVNDTLTTEKSRGNKHSVISTVELLLTKEDGSVEPLNRPIIKFRSLWGLRGKRVVDI